MTNLRTEEELLKKCQRLLKDIRQLHERLKKDEHLRQVYAVGWALAKKEENARSANDAGD